MIKGLLVVNNFYGGAKMKEIEDLLIRSGERHDIELSVRKTGELMHDYEALRPLKKEFSFVIFWDKDIVLARMLENIGFSVFNSAQAIEDCDNKALTYLKLAQSGIRMPKTIIAPLTFEGVGYNDIGFLKDASEVLGFPFVIKELYGSFGQQVYLVHDLAEALSVVDRLGHKGFLMQEFISASSGTDIRVNVVGRKVVSSMMRRNSNDWRSNISGGGSAVKYEVTDEQAALAIAACDVLGLDYAGVDVLLGEKGPLICEVNSNLHFKSSIDCTGVDVSDYIMSYIRENM